MDQILSNFWNDFIHSPYSDEMEEKYWRKLPRLSITETVQYILKNKMENKLVDTVFYGDARDKQQPYLLKIHDDKFEVFESERGGKFGVKTYTNLEDALFDYVDTVYNSYGLAAT